MVAVEMTKTTQSKHYSFGDRVFTWLDVLLNSSGTLSEWQSVVASVGRGVYALVLIYTGASLTDISIKSYSTTTEHIFELLRIAWPVAIVAVGMFQLFSLLRGSVYLRRIACILSVVVWSFSAYMFTAIEIKSKLIGVPLIPVYFSFVLASAVRFLRLGRV